MQVYPKMALERDTWLVPMLSSVVKGALHLVGNWLMGCHCIPLQSNLCKVRVYSVLDTDHANINQTGNPQILSLFLEIDFDHFL